MAITGIIAPWVSELRGLVRPLWLRHSCTLVVLAMMCYQCVDVSYVMSTEVSASCATYAQWLDDSTQVSAKDLVTSLTISRLSVCLFITCRLYCHMW